VSTGNGGVGMCYTGVAIRTRGAHKRKKVHSEHIVPTAVVREDEILTKQKGKQRGTIVKTWEGEKPCLAGRTQTHKIRQGTRGPQELRVKISIPN